MIKLLKEANLYELITIYLSMLFFSGFWFYDYGLTLGILTNIVLFTLSKSSLLF